MSLRLAFFALGTLAIVASYSTAHAAEWSVASVDQLGNVVKQARPGDSIVIAKGTYDDAELLFAAEGTEDRPITLKAEAAGQVVLTGKSRLRIAGRHLIVSGLDFQQIDGDRDCVEFRRDSKQFSDHCRLTECRFRGVSASKSKASVRWVSLYGSNNRVDHCQLEGKTTLGTTLVVWLHDQPNHHRIDHNYFGPRPYLKKNGGETIRVGDSKTSLSSSQTTVAHNLFEACNGETEIISNKSCDNVYRSNVFRRCEGTLTLRHGNRCTVAGNWFFGEGAKRTGGIRIIGEDHKVFNNYLEKLEGDDARATICMMNGIADSPLNGYFQVQRALVAHNSIVDCKVPLVVGYADEDVTALLAPKDCVVANNLFVGRDRLLVDVQSSADGCQFQSNLGSKSNGGADRADTDVNFVELVSQPQRRIPEKDAWVDRGTRLVENKGSQEELVPEDIEGQPRDMKPDIGCDENSDRPILRKPVTRAEVGPYWALEATK